MAGEEWVEGFLVCRACLAVRPVLGGSAILPKDLARHLDAQASVYRRTPLADPRVTRFVLAALGGGTDRVPFEEVTARYGDLAVLPGAPARPRAPEDDALDLLLHRRPPGTPLHRALDVGCGVGRGTFVLAAHGAEALGVDRSAARVRRARNLAVTEEGFRLHAPDDPGREVPLDLAVLARTAVDFAVADAESLPLASHVFDVVVLRAGDGLGPWSDAAGAAAEARRVLRAGGLLVEPAPAAGPAGKDEVERAGGWRMVRAA
jgi:SAM-dependent methyltransferase